MQVLREFAVESKFGGADFGQRLKHENLVYCRGALSCNAVSSDDRELSKEFKQCLVYEDAGRHTLEQMIKNFDTEVKLSQFADIAIQVSAATVAELLLIINTFICSCSLER